MSTLLSRPVLKAGGYFLLLLVVTLGFHLTKHIWPPIFLLGVVVGMACHLWRREQALEERVRLDRLQEAEAARRGKYGARRQARGHKIMLTILRRYFINGAAFLSAYLGTHIFGPSLWHYVAANVQHWWNRGASRDIISGLGGMAAFIVYGEYRRRERVARNVPATALRQPRGPWA